MPQAIRLPVCFIIVFLAIGIPAWGMPYNADPFTNMQLWPGALLLGVLPLWLTVTRSSTARRIFLVMSVCVPLVDIAMILRDTAIDPTNHNLWPFELVFAWIIGAGLILPGLLVGIILRAVMRQA